MPDASDVLQWRGSTMVDSDGARIGKIEEIYLDTETDRPEWGVVGTSGGSAFVPLQGATSDGGDVRAAFSKGQITSAPSAGADGELSQDAEAELYRHYGVDYGESRSDSGLPQGGKGTGERVDTDRSATTGRGVVGSDVSGAETDEAMTRSEEEVRVGVARRETGRARLRKHIVTEPVSETVTTQREELRVEREPITDANMGDAMSGGDLTEEEHEVTLSAEEAVVEKRVVPKERVRMDKEIVSDQQTVTDEIRKEQIEVDEGTTRSRDDVDVDRPGPGR